MKVIKRQIPVNKNCLHFVNAVLNENKTETNKMLKQLVLTNIRKKFKKAEKETDLF